jgi:hypothetical protein
VRATSGIDGGGTLIVVAGKGLTAPLCLLVLQRVAFAVWLLAKSLLTSQHLSVLRFCSLTISAYGRAGVQRALGETRTWQNRLAT